MKFPFKHWINQYLNFSKKDRNGILILSFLIFIILIINISLDFIKTTTHYDYSEYEKAISEWESSQGINNHNYSSLFPFNPNAITGEGLDSLALPASVKRNILSYRDAGGKINSADAFRKIYGMNDSIFDAVKDFLFFDSQNEINESNYLGKSNRSNDRFQIASDFRESNIAVFKIELNSTDSVELTKLNGIGPVFASRIIKYRNLLGGFYKKEQLFEVYNFTEEMYNKIEDNIEIDVGHIKKIRLNFADFAEMLRHPYLSREQVQAIINYRDKQGPFQSLDDLTQKNILDSITFLKVEPYIDCR